MLCIIVIHALMRKGDVKYATAKAITLRNLPEPVSRAVRERAAKYHISLNQAVIQLLEEVTGAAARSPRRYHDMDHLFGSISTESAEAMERAMREGRRIDPEEWT
jgi:hypothetical protein